MVAGELRLHSEPSQNPVTAESLPVDGFAYFPPGDTHRYSCWTRQDSASTYLASTHLEEPAMHLLVANYIIALYPLQAELVRCGSHAGV